MQESRIAVVSSTAAATLRQLVMFIIDKVVDEDKKELLKPNEYTETVLPDGTHKNLGPSALDAYSVVEDLCLLATALDVEVCGQPFEQELEAIVRPFWLWTAFCSRCGLCEAIAPTPPTRIRAACRGVSGHVFEVGS